VLAESLANAIVRTCAGPVVAGGVAIGAYVCVELARSHPELVRALVLSGAKAAPDSPTMLPQREAVARMALEQGSVAVADELAQHPLGPDATDEQRERIHDLIAAADPRAIAALVLGLARRPDPTPVLAALTVPVLVIAGSADPFVPLAESQRLAEVIPDGRLVTLDGVGHIAPLEAPDEYTAALGEFLTTLP
jgi:pimeloyl-ACP methyl ester carboxylesterase